MPLAGQVFSATRICSSRVAVWGMPVPPLACHVLGLNWAAAVAVAGVDAPVAAALALRDGVPVAAGGIGGGNDAAAGAMISAPAMAVRWRVW